MSGIGRYPAAAGEVDWSIRNSVNYAVSGVLTALELTSKFPTMVVENFYRKTANSIQAGQTKAPYAFVIPAGQRDQTQIDRVVNLLRRQAIEVHRLTASATIGKESFATGSYVVKLNQPYGRLAKTLLEKQTYPDPNLRTYDDSAWTMGLASNIEHQDRRRQGDTRRAGATGVSRCRNRGAPSTAPAQSSSSSTTASLNLVTLRFRLKDATGKGRKGDVQGRLG